MDFLPFMTAVIDLTFLPSSSLDTKCSSSEKDCCTQWVQPVCAGPIGWEREALELRTLALDLNPGSRPFHPGFRFMHPASVWGPRASVCKALEPLCGALELATQGILFLFTDGHTQSTT